MEGQKDRRMEGLKDGKMEGQKDGKMEGWKDRKTEGLRDWQIAVIDCFASSLIARVLRSDKIV